MTAPPCSAQARGRRSRRRHFPPRAAPPQTQDPEPFPRPQFLPGMKLEAGTPAAQGPRDAWARGPAAPGHAASCPGQRPRGERRSLTPASPPPSHEAVLAGCGWEGAAELPHTSALGTGVSRIPTAPAALEEPAATASTLDAWVRQKATTTTARGAVQGRPHRGLGRTAGSRGPRPGLALRPKVCRTVGEMRICTELAFEITS